MLIWLSYVAIVAAWYWLDACGGIERIQGIEGDDHVYRDHRR